MMEIRNLRVVSEKKELLHGINMKIEPEESIAIMGPNGAGKSTLAKTIAGHPSCDVVDGELLFDDKNIKGLSADERAKIGIFVSFQYQIEISGVSNFDFLYASFSAVRKAQNKKLLDKLEFKKLLFNKMEELNVKKEFVSRNLNEGFSGGEKKRNELLQMAILEPRLAILDEMDSGLDIDALKMVGASLSKMKGAKIFITHYNRLLKYVNVDRIYVMLDGKIVTSGPLSLANEIEEKGYDWLK